MNEAFLLLQDFEFTDRINDSSWVLLTASKLPDDPPKPTVPPLEEVSRNDFANASFNDINEFVRSNESKLKTLDLTTYNWLIIDQKGIDSLTCLVVEQVYDYDSEEGGPTNRF